MPIGVKVKLFEANFDLVMEKKTMLKSHVALSHVFIKRFLPIEEKVIQRKLVTEIKVLEQTQDPQGMIFLHGKKSKPQRRLFEDLGYPHQIHSQSKNYILSFGTATR